VGQGFLKVDMFELKLLAPQTRVEALSDVLEALDALSVSVEDADAHTPAERALFGEPDMPAPEPGWDRSRVTALFETRDLAEVAADALTDMTLFEGCAVQGVAELEDQDWVRLTQSQFTPVEITPDFWIVPTWHEPPAAARTFLRLDPGLAFGTGTHPTTRMCLRWIAQQDMANNGRLITVVVLGFLRWLHSNLVPLISMPSILIRRRSHPRMAMRRSIA